MFIEVLTVVLLVDVYQSVVIRQVTLKFVVFFFFFHNLECELKITGKTGFGGLRQFN